MTHMPHYAVTYDQVTGVAVVHQTVPGTAGTVPVFTGSTRTPTPFKTVDAFLAANGWNRRGAWHTGTADLLVAGAEER